MRLLTLTLVVMCALAPAAPSLPMKKILPLPESSACGVSALSTRPSSPGIPHFAPPAHAGLMKLRGGKGDGEAGSAGVHADQCGDQALAGGLETDQDRERLFNTAWDMDFFETGVDPLFMQARAPPLIQGVYSVENRAAPISSVSLFLLFPCARGTVAMCLCERVPLRLHTNARTNACADPFSHFFIRV